MSATPAPPPPPPAGPQNPTSGTVSLVMGIVGLVALPLIGSVLALVFGYQSRREAQERPDLYKDDLGQVGRVLGWVGLVLVGGFLVFGVLVLLVVLVFAV